VIVWTHGNWVKVKKGIVQSCFMNEGVIWIHEDDRKCFKTFLKGMADFITLVYFNAKKSLSLVITLVYLNAKKGLSLVITLVYFDI
jgi:hypothetical protein